MDPYLPQPQIKRVLITGVLKVDQGYFYQTHRFNTLNKNSLKSSDLFEVISVDPG